MSNRSLDYYPLNTVKMGSSDKKKREKKKDFNVCCFSPFAIIWGSLLLRRPLALSYAPLIGHSH